MNGFEFDNDCREYDHDFVSSGFLSAPPAAVCVLPDPRSLVLGNAVSRSPPLAEHRVNDFWFQRPGSVLRSQAAPGEHDKHRKFHFQKSYMAIVSVLAIPLVFHSWSNVLLNVGWRCVWLLLLMTKEKQSFHDMQDIYRNCDGNKYTVKSNDLAVSKSAIIFWKVCDHNTPNF